MYQSKLVKAISQLSAWELRHFLDYIHSPFFNKHERLSALVTLIADTAPDFEEAQLDRHTVYDKIFANGAFNEQKFKDLLSLGMKTFRSFLAHYHLRQDDFATGLALLRQLDQRGLDNEFNKTRKQLEKGLPAQTAQLQELEIKRLQLQETYIQFNESRAARKADDSIQTASDQLDVYFLLGKLKYGVEMANRRNVVGQDFDPGLLSPILLYLDQNPEVTVQNAGIRIYMLIYKALTEADSPVDALFEEVRQRASAFPKSERREVYHYALNFCIQQINRGQSHHLETLLDLYQNALDDETLINQGWLSQWDYKNIVSASLKAEKFDWCQNFIEGYRKKIEPGARDNAYTYNRASLHLEQGEYSHALRLLQHVEFSDVFYHLGSKVILLKSYFELRDDEALLNLCDTFKMYLKRNKQLSKYHYTVNWNLVSFTRKLSDFRSKYRVLASKKRKEKLLDLRTAIEEGGNVAQKAWLLKKIEAFSA